MQKFTLLDGLVMPLDRANVDTDALIPKQFLKSILRTGFGPNLFDEWRYLDHGEPGQDNSKRPLNPDFVLNQPRYCGATILLARKNFGCGSSREHRSEEHTSELQSLRHLVCRLLLEKKTTLIPAPHSVCCLDRALMNFAAIGMSRDAVVFFFKG